MKKKRELKYYLIAGIILTIFIIPFVSAGIIDWIKNTITGKDTFGPTNVSVTIAGVSPVTIKVWNQTIIGTVNDATEETFTDIPFIVTVSDSDGATDLNDSSVFAFFYRGTDMRDNSSVCAFSGQSTSTSRNYSCLIKMWYFDGPGTWIMNVSARDLGNQTIITNNTQTLQFDQLQAIKFSPKVVYWTSIVTGGTDQVANNYTTINNTGNYNVTSTNLQINATNLYSGASYMDVGNISADIDSGVSSCSGGTTLVDHTDTGITGAVIARGNLSIGGGIAQEEVYYCIPSVPMLPSGTYTTQTGGSWTIKII